MKFAFLLAFLVAGAAHAALPSPADTKNVLNLKAGVGAQYQLGDQLVDKKVHLLRARWDFADQGGAVSTIYLKDVADNKKAVIPPGALVQDCAIHVVTPVTGASGATLALSTGLRLEDLKDATGKASFTGSDSFIACDPVGTVASSVKLPPYTKDYTPAYTPTLTIGAAALTAGKIDVLIKYILTE